MKDTSNVCMGLKFVVPVSIKGISESGSLVAFQLTLKYNSLLLNVRNVGFKKSVFSDWDGVSWNTEDSLLIIAGFTVNTINTEIDSGNLFNIQLTAKADTVCTDSITFNRVLFYNLSGIEPSSYYGSSVLNFSHNLPPVISGISQINIFEDSSKTLDIRRIISDGNDSLSALSLTFRSSCPQLSVLYDTTRKVLKLNPQKNWFGSGKLFIKAEDPAGLKDSLSMDFNVISLPDAPGRFLLISPEDSLSVNTKTPLTFCWTKSFNADPGDTILYRFSMDSNPDFSAPDFVVSLADTVFNLSDIPDPGVYFWKVVAYDKDGLYTLCDKMFCFIISDQSNVQTNELSEFRLWQNSPNPFNQSTQIIFSLKFPQNTKIVVYDMQGRLVKILADNFFTAGTHKIEWKGRDFSGKDVSSGIYIIKLTTPFLSTDKKCILLR